MPTPSQRGLAELVKLQLLEFHEYIRIDPLSAIGTTQEREYSLMGPSAST